MGEKNPQGFTIGVIFAKGTVANILYQGAGTHPALQTKRAQAHIDLGAAIAIHCRRIDMGEVEFLLPLFCDDLLCLPIV